MKLYNVYTDGACTGNPGPGGWAAAIHDNKWKMLKQISGGFRRTTNNRMEILAAINALEEIKRLLGEEGLTPDDASVAIFSDSQNLVMTMTAGWARNANNDLWGRLIVLKDEFAGVAFQKVKGHSKDQLNNLVDRIAVEACSEGKKLDIDEEYENSAAQPAREPGLFANEDEKKEKKVKKQKEGNAEPRIKEIRLTGMDSPSSRAVEVHLDNGTVVHILPVPNAGMGFQQNGCTKAEAALTVDVAFRFIKWLNGGDL